MSMMFNTEHDATKLVDALDKISLVYNSTTYTEHKSKNKMGEERAYTHSTTKLHIVSQLLLVSDKNTNYLELQRSIVISTICKLHIHTNYWVINSYVFTTILFQLSL